MLVFKYFLVLCRQARKKASSVFILIAIYSCFRLWSQWQTRYSHLTDLKKKKKLILFIDNGSHSNVALHEALDYKRPQDELTIVNIAQLHENPGPMSHKSLTVTTSYPYAPESTHPIYLTRSVSRLAFTSNTPELNLSVCLMYVYL